MLNRSASLAMSTCVLKALPGKLDIKRHSPSILYIDSLLCICGRIETTKHYLFECNRFSEFCQEMMQEVSSLCEPILDT